MKKFTLLSMALLAGACVASATTLGYSYASADGEYTRVGTAKKELLNVAISVGPAAAGMQITQVTVPVVPSENISDFSVWIADNLRYVNVNGKNTNETDYSVEATYPTEGAEIEWVTVELPEPYTVPADGTYVGYTMNVTTPDEVTKYPLVVAQGAAAGSLYIFSSRTYMNWADRSEDVQMRSMLQVTLEGDAPEYAVKLGSIPYVYLGQDVEGSVSVDVYNVGTSPVESFTYTVEVGDQKVEDIMTFDTPLEANLALVNSVEFTIPALPEPGDYDVTITLQAVNGVAYEAETSGTVGVLYFVPKHYSVVEEYTGTWCGYCPRGYVAMEEMDRLYDDFVGIAYHDSDAMTPVGGYPNMISGFPSAVIGRTNVTDAYYADSSYGNGFTMPQAWEAACAEFSFAGLEVEAEIPENDENTVVVNSTVTFAATAADAATANYRLEIVLTADGLTGEGSNWNQSNYYYSYSPFYLMEDFCSGGQYGSSKVEGLVFNDVAILHSGLKGINGSIPDPSANVPNEYEYKFDISNVVSAYTGEAIPFHRDQLDVVVMILKGNTTYGVVENAIKVPVKYHADGVKAISVNREVESEVYYDLQGRMVRNPENGVYIRSIRYTDGTVANDKVVK